MAHSGIINGLFPCRSKETKGASTNDYSLKSELRTVPTIVIAHTFCASPDTRIFLSVVLTNAGIFLRGLKLFGESRT